MLILLQVRPVQIGQNVLQVSMVLYLPSQQIVIVRSAMKVSFKRRVNSKAQNAPCMPNVHKDKRELFHHQRQIVFVLHVIMGSFKQKLTQN
jgi:hypothetical protein